MTKMLIATADAFSKDATFIARGQVVSADAVDWKEGEPGFIAAPSGVTGAAVVEISAIAPTGPNPKNPQQISNTTVQTAAGYVDQGALLVGEVTAPAKVRIVDSGIEAGGEEQAQVMEALAQFDRDGDGKPGGSKKRAAKEETTEG